jgi:hypothetical protein
MRTKQTIRAAALGMLFATSVMGTAYYIEPKTLTKAKLDDVLEKEGLVAIRESEYKKLIEAAKKKQSTLAPINPSSPKTVFVYSLTIQKGDVPNDFAQKLENAHIISDADALVAYLQTHGLTRYIRPGTYQVHSDMSYEEISKLITNSSK